MAGSLLPGRWPSVAIRSVIIDNPSLSSTTPRVLPDTAVRQFSICFDTVADLTHVPGIDTIELPPDLVGAVARRQWEFRAGRLCAQNALAVLGYPRPDVRIPRTAHGAPGWPYGITGSITHTDGYVSAAVARADVIGALGIDSERVLTEDRLRSVAGTIAWASELSAARDAGYERIVSATLVFSAKETIFKCLRGQVGRMFDFRDVRLVGINATRHQFTARLVTTLCPAWRAGMVITGRFAIEMPFVHTAMALAASDAHMTKPSGTHRSPVPIG